MSEFVLKLATWTGGDERPVVWLPGVAKVSRLDRSTLGECIDKWDKQHIDYSFLDPTADPKGDQRTMVVTLIWLETDSYSGPMAVEQAWLLGPGGGTVERISGY